MMISRKKYRPSKLSISSAKMAAGGLVRIFSAGKADGGTLVVQAAEED